MNPWAVTAYKMKTVTCFPVRIYWDESKGKWQKRPVKGMTEWQFLQETVPLDDPRWDRANGFGILMNRGLYALDVDPQKGNIMDGVRAWFDKHGLSKDTRTHQTPSGGWHFIYRAPPKWGDLRTRAGIINGLDGRGGKENSGGWIAFGEHYKLVRKYPPAFLTESACKAIENEGGVAGTRLKAFVGGYVTPANENNILERLTYLIQTNSKINRRWRGLNDELSDKSRSALDMSLAWYLAAFGFREREIAFVLLELFQHGQARFLGRNGERAAMRCAARATAFFDIGINFREPPTLTPDQEANLMAIIG